MSIRRDSITRNIEARKASVPTIGRGVPSRSEGKEGDIAFRVTPAGAIPSTSGTIGGWTLSSTTLSATNITIDSTNRYILISDD